MCEWLSISAIAVSIKICCSSRYNLKNFTHSRVFLLPVHGNTGKNFPRSLFRVKPRVRYAT
jgi:hypothetical protein